VICNAGFRYDYLSLYKQGRLWLRDQVQALEPVEGFRTIVAGYDAEIRNAVHRIRTHFSDKASVRPLNCLLLGPPGAGKSTLGKKLAEATCGKDRFTTINCAHYGSPDELGAQLEKISAKADEDKIVLVDECDVTLAGSSAIRYLIDPMYSGEDYYGNKFNKTVFLFCGSYLRSREIINELEDRATSLAVPKLLYDVMLAAAPEQREVLRDGFLASAMLADSRARTSPRLRVVKYLRELEKLADFLSRINGPIIEIPDVSRPLEVSKPHFVISSGRVPGDPGRDHLPKDEMEPLKKVGIGSACSPHQLLKFVTDTELPRLPAGHTHVSVADQRFRFGFKYRWDPFLAFKNMMIIERLLRVCDMISRALGGESNFDIRADELNFLTLVPVVHGLRSVETIIMRLLETKKHGDRNSVTVNKDRFDLVVKSQIVDDRSYSNPSLVWNWIVQHNSRALRTPGNASSIAADQMITVMVR
jgi:ATPase family associated with various cellular activities (AAA)